MTLMAVDEAVTDMHRARRHARQAGLQRSAPLLCFSDLRVDTED